MSKVSSTALKLRPTAFMKRLPPPLVVFEKVSGEVVPQGRGVCSTLKCFLIDRKFIQLHSARLNRSHVMAQPKGLKTS